MADGGPQRAPGALEHGLQNVVRVLARQLAQVQRDARFPRQRQKEFLAQAPYRTCPTFCEGRSAA